MPFSLKTFLWIFLPLLIISDICVLSVVRNSGLYNIMLVSNAATAFSFWSCYNSDRSHKWMPNMTTTLWLTMPLLACFDMIEYFLATCTAERICAVVVNASWMFMCLSHFFWKNRAVGEIRMARVTKEGRKPGTSVNSSEDDKCALPMFSASI